MSKVRVIFEFNHVSHDEKLAGNDCVEVHEKIGVDVKTERDTDNRPTSLCDVYASILQYHSLQLFSFSQRNFRHLHSLLERMPSLNATACIKHQAHCNKEKQNG